MGEPACKPAQWLLSLCMALGMVSVSHAQRFVRPINSIPELIVSNPNDPHTNVFIPQGPSGPGLFYQWRKNDAEATNANQSVLGSDWPGASGRWYNIPIAQGAIDGISNSGTNGFAVVNTLADLRNVPGNLGIGMVYVRGHSQPDDWGRGFFSRLDDCSIPDDDAYSIHGNDALTCWKRENDLPWSGIPVQYFGGTITVATINRATAYLESIGGGAAFITDGAWAMDTTNGPIILRNSVTIAGSASAMLVGDGYGTMFGGTNIHNAQILEIGISNVVTGVLIRGGTNILIGGNSFFDVGEGVRQYGGDDVRIEVNRFAEATNGIHFSLDGAVQVTQGALNGNTFSGVVNSNVLADTGSTDGYQRYDSGADFRLARKDSVVSFGTNRVIFGEPGVVQLGPGVETYFGSSPTDPAIHVLSSVPLGGSGISEFTGVQIGSDGTLVYNGFYGDATATGLGSTTGFVTSQTRPQGAFSKRKDWNVVGTLYDIIQYMDMGTDVSTGRTVTALHPGMTNGYLNLGWRDGFGQSAYYFDTAWFITNQTTTLGPTTDFFSLFRVGNFGTNLFNVMPDGSLVHREIAAPPAPLNGFGRWYVGTDSKPRFIADDGTDYDLTDTGGGASMAVIGFQNIGSGTDYDLTDTYARVVFGTSGADFVLTNAGTYQIIVTVAAFANNTFGQQYYLTNSTDGTSVPGSSHEIGSVSSAEAPLTIAVQYTTTAPNKTIQLWGKTLDTTYSGAPKVISTKTVTDVMFLGTGSGSGPAFSDLVWTNDPPGIIRLIEVTNRINLANTTTEPGTGTDFVFGTWDLTGDKKAINFYSIWPGGTNSATPHIIGLGASDPATINADQGSTAWWAYNYLAGIDTASSWYWHHEQYGLIGEASNYGDDSGSAVLPGASVGGVGYTGGYSGVQVGLSGVADATIAGQTNIGVAGIGRTGGSVAVGGFFEVGSSIGASSRPNPVSAALMADNRTTGLPVFIARTNQVEVFSIAGTGIGTFANDLFVPAEIYDASGWDADLSVPTKDSVRDKIESLSSGGAPTTSQYLTLALDAGLSAERVLTGTANQIVLTDGGANGNLTLSTPQDIATFSTPQFSRIGLGAAASGTSALSVPAGTSANPSIVFASDDDGTGTGIYRGAANTVSVAINGTENMSMSATRFQIKAGATVNLVGDSTEVLQIALDAAAPLASGIKGADGVGTDKVGGEWNYQAGRGTGSGTPGDVSDSTSLTAGTGSTVQSYQKRRLVRGKEVTLTESTATLVVNVALASGKFLGIRIFATTHADDATDFQAVSEVLAIAAVNKAGTVTATVSASSPTATIQSAGTLTTAWTAVANSNSIDIKCNAVSSLTQTTLKTKYRIDVDSDDTAVITP